jgi:DNA polymerase-3 subunit delta'
MEITDVIKKQDFFQSLLKKKEHDTLLSSIMFFCDDEITNKKTLILTALMLEYKTFELFNDKSAEFLKIESGGDLDVKVYPKNGEKLLVSDANEIVFESFIKPINHPYKIFIINNFDVSTEEAQNKLLKVLEEPQQNVFFLLGVKNEEKVLPTIKSRCEKVKILPLAESEMQIFCQDNLARVLGEGYIGKTIALSKNKDLRLLCDFAVSLFTELKSSKQVLEFSKRFIDEKANITLILQVMSLCIEDIIKIKCDSKDLCKLTPYVQGLKDVEPEFSVEALCETSHLISSLREKLEFNANLTSAIDNFLLKMLEVKFLCK